jgi:DNA-binding response OmpR family regulator
MLGRASGHAEGTLRILVVDDDPSVRTALRLLLNRDGYDVSLAANGREALDMLGEGTPFDIVVLDWVMPEMDGLETCKRIRERSMVPVLMVTARSAESDKVRVLDVGADDYITKPFGPRELLARVRALTRRAQMPAVSSDELTVGDVTIDPSRGEVAIEGRRIGLTPTEQRLMLSLAASPGQARSARELARALGLADCSDRDAQEIVKVNVLRLRRKIEDDSKNPRRLVNHRGYGYSLATGKAG